MAGGELQQVLENINSLTAGSFEPFLVERGICPECLGELKQRQGEQVCLVCGLVTGVAHGYSSVIPFGENCAPVNQLGASRGLGGTLGERGLFCVLARARGVEDLPIRARHITTITRRFDHPKLASMLRLGRNRAEEWGFSEHKLEASIVFSNYFGIMLRRVGAFLVLSKERFSLRQVVDACFALSMKTLIGENKYDEVVSKLEIKPEIVQYVDRLHKLLLVRT